MVRHPVDKRLQGIEKQLLELKPCIDETVELVENLRDMLGHVLDENLKYKKEIIELNKTIDSIIVKPFDRSVK